MELSFSHRFKITLPREYPQNLSQIMIINETPLYHPRITGIGSKACYSVNGEIDRILVDILYNVLMRPETVRPPNKYKDADRGLDTNRMKWYIKNNPDEIHSLLWQEWGKRQQRKKPKIMIME